LCGGLDAPLSRLSGSGFEAEPRGSEPGSGIVLTRPPSQCSGTRRITSGTKATLVRDRTDSRWTPTAGDRFSLSYEQVYGEYSDRIDQIIPRCRVQQVYKNRILVQVAGRIEAIVDAEVLQEILHRYRALNRWTDGRRVFDLARRIFPIVIPITSEILDRTRRLLDEYKDLMARDALHAAVVEIHSLEAICSYDRDFDRVRTIRRTEPR